VRHAYGSDPNQWAQLSRAHGLSRGVAVVIHGGFWRTKYDASLGEDLARDLALRGWDAYNVEYRRVGGGGGWPTTLRDIADAIDFLATVGLDLTRVVAIGHSAGGHLATWAGGRAQLSPGEPGASPRVELTGVIAQAGVLDLRSGARDAVGGTAIIDLLGGSPEEVPERYDLADPLSMAPLEIPVFCVHSTEDDSVPFSQSESYVSDALRLGAVAELLEFHGDHMEHVDPTSGAWQLALEALDRLAE